MSFSNNTIENRGMMEDLATYFDKSVPIQMIERQMDILLDLIEELNSYRKRIKLGIERARSTKHYSSLHKKICSSRRSI